MMFCAAVAAALAAWLLASRELRIPVDRERRGTPVIPDGGASAARPGGSRSRQRSNPRGAEVLGADDAALLLDLSATLLQAGLPVSKVLKVLSDAVPGCESLGVVVRSLELSIPWRRAWSGVPMPLSSLGESLAFSHLTGAATAALLQAAADQQRHADIRAAERRAAELGVRLVVPLGVCALPAFICLGIIPVVISLLPTFG